jgi:hypothetical protein
MRVGSYIYLQDRHKNYDITCTVTTVYRTSVLVNRTVYYKTAFGIQACIINAIIIKLLFAYHFRVIFLVSSFRLPGLYALVLSENVMKIVRENEPQEVKWIKAKL